MTACEQPVEKGGARAAHVQIAGWRGSESNARRHENPGFIFSRNETRVLWLARRRRGREHRRRRRQRRTRERQGYERNQRQARGAVERVRIRPGRLIHAGGDRKSTRLKS